MFANLATAANDLNQELHVTLDTVRVKLDFYFQIKTWDVFN